MSSTVQINQLPAVTTPAATDVLPVQQADGTTRQISPGQMAVTPTGGSTSQTLADNHAVQGYYSPGAYTATVPTLASAASTAGVVQAAFNTFNGAPNPGVYPGFSSYGIGAFDLNKATTSLLDGLVVGEVTAFGYGAAAAASTPKTGNFAASITAIGYKALTSLVGSQVTAIGNQAGIQMTTGNSSVLVGTHAGRCITTGTSNVAIGHGAMAGTDTPNTPFPLGTSTITTGSYNHIVGTNAGQQITTGNRNMLMGYVAGHGLFTGSDNIAIGDHALLNAETNGCVAVGSDTLHAYTGAGPNMAIGLGSSYSLTTGVNNIFIGERAGVTETTGNRSVYFGDYAGASSVGVSDNVFIGYYAANSGGNYNSVNDSLCVMIGSFVARDSSVPSSTPITNAVIIGAHATGDLSNAVFLGNTAVTAAYLGGTSTTGMQLLANQGVTASTTNTVTNKVKVSIGGTVLYLLASTSAP